MTSWPAPNYQIKFVTSEVVKLKKLAGNTFRVSILRKSRPNSIGGMLMQGLKTINEEMCCYLWINSKKSIIPLSEPVKITLLNECDPMYQLSNEKTEIGKLLPITFIGEINKIS